MTTLLDAYSDFQKSERSAYVRGPQEITNDIVNRTYVLAFMTKGKNERDTFVSGTDLKWFIRLDATGTAHFYRPGVTKENPSLVNTLSTGTANIRYLRDSMVWSQETLMQNLPGNDELGLAAKIVDLSDQMQDQCWIEQINKMEATLWAQPDVDAMETLTATSVPIPYSLPTIFNEFASGLPSVTGNVFTTICGISSSAKPNWDNQRQGYKSVGEISGASALPHLFYALRLLYGKLSFHNLPMEARIQKASMPQRILCSLDNGIGAFVMSMQSSKTYEMFVGKQDPQYPNPTFLGIPLDGIDALTTATCFPTGAANLVYSTEMDGAGTNNSGPRYFMLNFDHVTPKWHREMYFYKHAPIVDVEDPSTKVQYVDTYYQVVPVSRKRGGGVVYPTADITLS